MLNNTLSIFIVGHNDILEKGLYQFFQRSGYRSVFSSSDMGMDTSIQPVVYEFFARHKPDIVILGSTRSGGIQANREYPADFIYHNTATQMNVVYASWKFGVKKLLFLGSSCVYPKDCPQPIRPEYLLSGPMEKTSEPYSIAKLNGIKLCQSFRAQYGLNAIVAVPATVYGPMVDVDPARAHVLGALMVRFHQAVREHDRHVVIWGSGRPRREFIYIDDFVEACVCLLMRYNGEDIIHIGSGEDCTIKELAELIATSLEYKGQMIFDKTKPDGSMQKLLDSAPLQNLGWKPEVGLLEGIERMLSWYRSHLEEKKSC
ncbi:MAG: NAD-dependent epimerase/dehydratase family protein [Candidatus Omnitrophica bacterium]|nr:NAD-dependent epimerase/dehydratase family protein [Candidatus Omnitrophota bacterium]